MCAYSLPYHRCVFRACTVPSVSDLRHACTDRQLIKLAFDEEVTAESIERLKKLIQRLRAPPTIAELFAFRGQHFVAASAGSKDKQKNATLR